MANKKADIVREGQKMEEIIMRINYYPNLRIFIRIHSDNIIYEVFSYRC